jgi:transposase
MAGASTLGFLTTLLNLPGFVVVNIREEVGPNRYHFTLIPEHSFGICPSCGKASNNVKQRRTRDTIQDLPIGTHAVELTVRVSQFSCDSCGECFTPPIGFLADGSHATERLLERAVELIRHSDVANVARFFGIKEKNLERWYYDYIERHRQTVETPKGKIRRIGIDELSLKKSTDSSSP